MELLNGVPHLGRLFAELTVAQAKCNVEWLDRCGSLGVAWLPQINRRYAKPMSLCGVQWEEKHRLPLDQYWSFELPDLAGKMNKEFPSLGVKAVLESVEVEPADNRYSVGVATLVAEFGAMNSFTTR